MEKQFVEFLFKAKRNTYAVGENGVKEPQSDGSTIMRYQNKQLVYVDRFYGGEPYIGEEILFYDNMAVWGMNYTGRLIEANWNLRGDVYAFLQMALKENGAAFPARGPEIYRDADYTYRTNIKGTVEFFSGYEEVLFRGEVIYKGYYHGGSVNTNN
ncbi:MAG TPA: DUF5680 domain-containing protein [Spirochaetota bacterium]|nr:DUF5680 domain-containing protein [Spirochaetota bacterium]